jgi:hypothetical protein
MHPVSTVPARLVAVLIAAFVMMAGVARAQDAGEAGKTAHAQATALVEALKSGDADAIIARTPKAVLDMAGGADNMKSQLKALKDQMAANGMTIAEVKVEPPAKVTPVEGKADVLFTILTTSTKLSTKDLDVDSPSYLLGRSEDGGKNWMFVDGAGIADKATAKTFFPDLPDAVELPARQQPKVTPKAK